MPPPLSLTSNSMTQCKLLVFRLLLSFLALFSELPSPYWTSTHARVLVSYQSVRGPCTVSCLEKPSLLRVSLRNQFKGNLLCEVSRCPHGALCICLSQHPSKCRNYLTRLSFPHPHPNTFLCRFNI